jgi:selenocysteine lyase/cysteine desulfurase
LSNREEREEGGTPDVIGDVKLGLVVALKQQFNASWIEQEELQISRYAQERLRTHAHIVLLGRQGGWSVGGGADKQDSGLGKI